MEDKIIDEFKENTKSLLDNLYAPFNYKLIAYSETDFDYNGFFREIIDDLETFYDVSKYPAVEIAISLLRDYSELACHYPSKKTLKLLKSWRKK